MATRLGKRGSTPAKAMGTRKRTDTDKEASEPAWRRTALLTPRLDARAALAVPIAVVGAGLSAYLFRASVADSYFAVKNDVVTTVGLGVVPIGLWLAVLSWALLARRSWLRYVNLWVSSLALVFVVLGAFAFFEPYRGGLAEFTLDGEVSLGGEVGTRIIGSSGWLGGMRLAGIFLAGVAFGAPPLARDAAVAVGGLAVYGYVATFVSLRSLVGSARMKSMPSLRLRPLWPRRGEIEPDTELEQSTPSESELTTAPATGRVSIEEKLNLSRAVPIRTDQHPMIPAVPEAEEEDELDPSPGEIDEAELFEAEVEPEEKDTPAGTPTGKFNKLWGPPATQSEDSPDEDEEPQAAGRAVEWTRPSTDLLVEAEAGDITEDDMRTTADKIKRTLAEYGVEVEIGQIKPGPTVTMYGLIPGWVRRYKQEKQTDESGRPRLDHLGKPVTARVESKTRVKVDSILSREKDLALALRTPSIRIETPVMGKSLVGIEVPNPNPTLVTLRSVMEGPEFERLRERGHLPVALGRGSGGETVVTDLVKMPHLLIAGATGSGKRRMHQRDHLVPDHGEDTGRGAPAANRSEAGGAHALQRDTSSTLARRGGDRPGGRVPQRHDRRDAGPLSADGGGRRQKHRGIQQAHGGQDALPRRRHRRAGRPHDVGVLRRGAVPMPSGPARQGNRNTPDCGYPAAVGRRGDRPHQSQLPQPYQLRRHLSH